VTPIRPNAILAQPPASAAAGPEAARAAAQRAFFDAAMGRSAAPQAPAAPRPAAVAPGSVPIQRAEIRPQPSSEVPQRILRPGSLLDIKV